MKQDFNRPNDMESGFKSGRVKLVYFSGTGGTARVALSIAQRLKDRGIAVTTQPLEGCREVHSSSDEYGNNDLLILVYAVHALDAPEPVYEWIKTVQSGNGIPAAVISVSGGGEVWPNTACRVSCIHALERKGFHVFYERMIIMPSNVLIATREHLAVRLLQILPAKLEKTVADILAGVTRRSTPSITARGMAFLFKLEKPYAKFFAKTLSIRETCTGCGWCARNCPRRNIAMIQNRPTFGWRCIICLRCLYGCPQKAIFTKLLSFIVLKEGYNLNKLEERKADIKLEPIEELAPGFLFAGLRDYLLSD